MANSFPEATARWLKDFPQVNGWYWVRDASTGPVLAEVLHDCAYINCSRYTPEAGDEWLGPITPEQATSYDALRFAAQEAVDFIEAIGRDSHYVYSPEAAETVSHNADVVLTKLRTALHPQGEEGKS